MSEENEKNCQVFISIPPHGELGYLGVSTGFCVLDESWIPQSVKLYDQIELKADRRFFLILEGESEGQFIGLNSMGKQTVLGCERFVYHLASPEEYQGTE